MNKIPISSSVTQISPIKDNASVLLRKYSATANSIITNCKIKPLSPISPSSPKSTLTPASEEISSAIEPLSLNEARNRLSNYKCCGYLNKMGFKWLKRWKRRYVVLTGKTLSYYEV